MSTTGPDQAAAIAQLRARGRQLAPPTDPTTGQPAAAKASAAPASSSTPAPAAAAAPANSSKSASPSTSTSKATKSAPRARQYRTNAGPPVHEIPTNAYAKHERARGIKMPAVPEQVTSTAARGGGIMLGLVAYSIGINYLRNGWPGVKAWFAAKFLNQTTSGPGKANIISPNAPITAPSGGTVSV